MDSPYLASDLRGGRGISDLTEFPLESRLDEQSLRLGHLLIAASCCLLLLIDGYDLHVTGQLLPAVARGLGVSTATLAIAFAVQTTGQATGAFILSPFADRFGRRPILLLCLLLFGIVNLISAAAVTVPQFAVTRFIGGALGGALMPVTISLTADLAPRKWRSTLVGLAYLGLSFGQLPPVPM